MDGWLDGWMARVSKPICLVKIILPLGRIFFLINGLASACELGRVKDTGPMEVIVYKEKYLTCNESKEHRLLPLITNRLREIPRENLN